MMQVVDTGGVKSDKAVAGIWLAGTTSNASVINGPLGNTQNGRGLGMWPFSGHLFTN